MYIDIDECNTTMHNCSEADFEQCVNGEGSFTCECMSGFERLDGICEGIELYNIVMIE